MMIRMFAMMIRMFAITVGNADVPIMYHTDLGR
jgi:hypothetical protein